jgi:hypothetical protein
MSLFSVAEKFSEVIKENKDEDLRRAFDMALLANGLALAVAPAATVVVTSPKPAAPAPPAPPVEKKPEVPNTVVATSPM